MSLNRQEKAIVIEEVTTQVATAQSIVVAEYRGLDVASVTVLRKNARESGVYLRVLKNSLARRAVAGTPFEALSDKLVGPLIYGSVLIQSMLQKCFPHLRKTTTSWSSRLGHCPTAFLMSMVLRPWPQCRHATSCFRNCLAPCRLRSRNLYVLSTKFRPSSCVASRLCAIRKQAA